MRCQVSPGNLLLHSGLPDQEWFKVDWTGRQVAVSNFEEGAPIPYLFPKMESALLLLEGMLLSYVDRQKASGVNVLVCINVLVCN